jgi:hypothetical protein
MQNGVGEEKQVKTTDSTKRNLGDELKLNMNNKEVERMRYQEKKKRNIQENIG